MEKKKCIQNTRGLAHNIGHNKVTERGTKGLGEQLNGHRDI